MTWHAIELPSGKAERRHESEVYPSDTVLFSSPESGDVRAFVERFNVEADEARRRFLDLQRGLFEDAL